MSPSDAVDSKDELPKEKPGCWTSRRVFAQVRHGSNIQLLPYFLVTVTSRVVLSGRPWSLHGQPLIIRLIIQTIRLDPTGPAAHPT
jgi:hypothetical protein